jgi:hypothetical protein
MSSMTDCGTPIPRTMISCWNPAELAAEVAVDHHYGQLARAVVHCGLEPR